MCGTVRFICTSFVRLGLLLVYIDPVWGQQPIQSQPAEVQVIKAKDSTVVVLSGVGPVDNQGQLVAPGDFPQQFKQTWENIRRLAAAAGTPIGKIVSMTVYTTDAKWQEVFNKMQREAFDGWYPATTFAVANKLRTPGALLEIHAVAVIAERKAKR